MKYIFVFGRTPDLSFLELQTFFPNAILLEDRVGLVKTDTPVNIDMLGGTVKIAEIVGEYRKLTAEILAPHIGGARNFGISAYTGAIEVSRNFLEHVKKLVGGRFVENLTSVLITKQHVTEIVIAKYEGKFLLGKTVAVQDFEAWNKRDYGRPYADPKSGMLPPKVARMVVNIALGKELRTENDEPKTLLDPFCGMGTVLGEALLSGWNIVGSDQSAKTVEKSKKNIEWVDEHYQFIDELAVNFFVSDAAHVSEKLGKKSVDAIVTEPFMGAAQRALPGGRVSIANIKNIIKGLEKLYIGCLKDWGKVLKSGGKIVIALPEYAIGGKTYFVKKVIDNCENFGYTVLHGPIEYSRPQAIVRRQFFVLLKI